METNNSHKGFTIATIVLLVLIFIGVSVIHSQLDNTEYIKDDDSTAFNEVNSNIMEMQEQINELESRLAKQNSILDSCKVKCDDYDLHTLKGNIVAKIKLKQYTDNTKVRLTIGDTTADLKLKNDVFIGKLNMDITKLYDEFTVSVDENGTKSSETVSNISELDENVGDLDWEYYLSEQGSSDCNFYQEDDELTINSGKYEIKIPSPNKLKENPILYIVNGNKEILKRDMSYNEEKADFEAEIDKDIAVKNATDCRIYTQFTLDTGEIVQYNYDSFGDDDDEDEEQLICINGKDVQFEYMD